MGDSVVGCGLIVGWSVVASDTEPVLDAVGGLFVD